LIEKGKEVVQKKNWIDTMSKELEDIKMTWEEAKEVATERTLWRRCVARCAAGMGRTKV